MRRKRRRRERRGEEGSSKKRNKDDIMWPAIPEIFIICFAENICDLCTGAWSLLLTCALFEGIDKQRGAQ